MGLGRGLRIGGRPRIAKRTSANNNNFSARRKSTRPHAAISLARSIGQYADGARRMGGHLRERPRTYIPYIALCGICNARPQGKGLIYLQYMAVGDFAWRDTRNSRWPRRLRIFRTVRSP